MSDDYNGSHPSLGTKTIDVSNSGGSFVVTDEFNATNLNFSFTADTVGVTTIEVGGDVTLGTNSTLTCDFRGYRGTDDQVLIDYGGSLTGEFSTTNLIPPSLVLLYEPGQIIIRPVKPGTLFWSE